MVLSRTFRPLMLAGVALGLLLSAAVRAQAQHHGGGPGGGPDGGSDRGFGGMGGLRDGVGPPSGGMDRGDPREQRIAPQMRSGPQLAPQGRWWDDNKTVKKLGLRPEQKQRMDEIFIANEATLVNGYLTLQREELRLNALSPQDLQDETKIFAAIDRVSQARTDLAKEIAHFQLQLRQQLSPTQLSTLDHEIASLR